MNCSYLTNRNPFIVQHVELRPIDSVIPLGDNPRTNSEAQIVRSPLASESSGS